MSEWISVKDRLPENGERVLAYGIDRRVHDVKWSWPENAWLDKIGGGTWMEGFITHWMPLSEPPKEV